MASESRRTSVFFWDRVKVFVCGAAFVGGSGALRALVSAIVLVDPVRDEGVSGEYCKC